MNRRSFLFLAFLVVLLGMLNLIVVVFAQGIPPDSSPETEYQSVLDDTAFIYQGLLEEGNSSADGDYDFRFTVYDAADGGNIIGSQLTIPNVAVEDGLFTEKLDFGMNIFTGEPRYLQIHVRPSSVGNFEPLSPRQQLLPVPYALHAGQVPWSGITDIPPDLNIEYPISSRQNLSINTIDTGVENSFIAMTTGIDGYAIIAYTDTSQNLKVAHCDNYLCSAVTTTQIDSNIADKMGITIGTDGHPIISYANNSGQLKVAHCEEIICTSSSIVTVSTVSNAASADVTIGSDGYPIMAVTLSSNAGGVYHCTNIFCSSGSFTSIISLYSDASIAIRGNGRPYLTYQNSSNSHRLYRCSDNACSNTVTPDNYTTGFSFSNISLTSNGYPIIAGDGGTLPADSPSILFCKDIDCTPNEEVKLPNSSATKAVAVTIGADGLPVGSYLPNGSNKVELFHVEINCLGSCSDFSNSFELPDFTLSSDDGQLAMAVDGDGFTLIAVTDDSNTLYLVRSIVGRGQQTP